jgi:hypothetical protein
MWAVGCILVEIYSGDNIAFFSAENFLEHLALMEGICGPIDPRLIEGAPQTQRESFFEGKGLKPAPKVKVPGRLEEPLFPQIELILQTFIADVMFRGLLKKIFAYHPADRVDARAALVLPYFTG